MNFLKKKYGNLEIKYSTLILPSLKILINSIQDMVMFVLNNIIRKGDPGYKAPLVGSHLDRYEIFLDGRPLETVLFRGKKNKSSFYISFLY